MEKIYYIHSASTSFAFHFANEFKTLFCFDFMVTHQACQESLEDLKAATDPCAQHVELAKMNESVTLIPW